MTTFTTTNSQLESLYVGYFGRAADPAGLQYWTNQLNAGTISLAGISASFSVQPEAIAKYPYLASPTVSDPTTFVNSVYNQLFGHTADTAGLAFWVAQLNAAKGSPTAVGQMILNIISGATGTDDTVIKNRVDVATDFTTQAANAGTTWNAAAAAQSSAELATVTDTAASVTAAKAATTAFIATAPGPQLNFTLGIDALTTSAQNANFNAQLIFNPGTGLLVQSLQTGDSAVDTAPLSTTGNGGTFTATLNSVAVTPLVTLQGIPTHSVTSITAGSGYTGNTTGVSGLVTLNNNNSTASLTIGSAGAGIDKGGVAATTTTGATLLSTVNVNSVTAGATTVFVNTAALAGAADSLSINATGTFGATGALNTVSVKNDTAAAGAAANTYETITVGASGATFMNLADGTSGILSTTTLNVTGAGATTLSGGGIAENFSLLKTINASTQTGGLTVTGLATGATGLLAGAVLTSFKGGTGADSVDLSFMTAAQLQAITATNLDGGTGTARDTLVLSNAELTGTGTVNQTGFEIISSTLLTGTMDYSKWGTGIDTLAVTGAAASQAAAFTINNLTSGFTTTLGVTEAGTAFAFTWNAAGTGLTDSLTITQTGNGAAIPGHTTTGFEVVNETINNTAAAGAFTYTGLTATASAGGSVTHNLIDNYSGGALTITAESVAAGGSLVITGSGTSNIIFTAAPVAGTVNASGWGTGLAATAAGITYGGFATSAQSFSGSAGLDTFLGSTAADTVSGGAGNDVITNMNTGVGGVGVADQIATGTGVDQVTLRGDTASAATYAAGAFISDFTVGTGAVGTTDFITLSATGANYNVANTAFAASLLAATTAQGAWVVQSLTSAAGANAITNAANELVKLTTGVAAGASLQATFNSAIGTTTVTTATADKELFFTLYDTTNSRMDIVIVQNHVNNTKTFETGDVVTLVGTVSMSAADYANITANHFSVVAA